MLTSFWSSCFFVYVNLGCLKSGKQTKTIFMALGISDIWPDCYYQSLPQVTQSMCWAGTGPHPTLVLSMTWDLIWHRTGKVCVEHEKCTQLFSALQKTMVLAKLHRTFFSWNWLPGRQTMPPAGSVEASGDRDSCFGQCWEATVSSSKDKRDHLSSEKQVWLSDSWSAAMTSDINSTNKRR